MAKAPVTAASRYEAGLKETARVEGVGKENTVDRNRATWNVWTAGAELLKGDKDPEEFWKEWYKAKNGKEPDIDATYRSRVSEVGSLKLAAQKDLARLLDCWPAMGNDNKPTLSLQQFKDVAVLIKDGDTRSAEELRK